MSDTLKRYLYSSLTTFIAVFLLAVLPSISDITLESLKNGAYAGILLTAFRAAVKSSIEVVIPYIQSFLNK